MTVTELLQFAKAGWKPSDVKELLAKAEPETDPAPAQEPVQNTEPTTTQSATPEPGADNGTQNSGTTPTAQTEPDAELLNRIAELEKQLKQAQSLNVSNGTEEAPEPSAVEVLTSFMDARNGYDTEHEKAKFNYLKKEGK